MTKQPEVRIEQHDSVALIEIVAGSRRNALTPQLADELVSARATVEADPDIGAIVLATEGPTR